MDSLIKKFEDYMISVKQLAPVSVNSYIKDIERFNKFISKQDYSLLDATHYDVREFMVHMDNIKLKNNTIIRVISGLKNFYRFLVKKGLIEINPLDFISSPKKEKNIPEFMFENEIDFLISLPGTGNYINFRDTLIMELSYSTGARVSELVSINDNDVNNSDTIRIVGKGSKERIVPLGSRVINYLKEYLPLRKVYTEKKNSEDTALFLNRYGKRISDRGVRNIIYKYVLKGAMIKKISPHTFRHSIATHLINNGADIRGVQELLGHTSLSTTRIYTHITQDRIKKIYNNTHPRA